MTHEDEAVERSGERTPSELVEILRRLIHELSQPLTALRGSLEVALLGEVKEPECRAILQQSLEEAHRLAAGLATLRDVLEAEDPGEDFHEVNWKQLVAKAVRETIPAARIKGLQIVVETLADAYVKVNAPRAEASLRELLRLLIQRSAQSGSLGIRLSTHEGNAELSISEEGPLLATPSPASSFPERMHGTELSWWILRRSFEIQGGKFEIEAVPSGHVRCRVLLPVALSDNSGTVSS
jgi:signal transduction histidine kinase